MEGRRNITQFEVISQLRYPLIVLVTFAHSYGMVANDFSLLTSEWNTYEFLKLLISQALVKVAVPVFFIISGYLFFQHLGGWSWEVWWQKIRRRAVTLLLPYLLWNLLMVLKLKTFSWSFFWAYIGKAGMQIDWLGREQWMTAPANMPLWFLRDLMVVILLSPLIYWIIRKLGGWLLLILTVYYLSGIYAFVPGLSAYALYFFMLGAFLSVRQKNLVAMLRRFEMPAYAASILLVVAMMLSYHTSVFSSLMLTFRITGAVSVFCIIHRLLSHTGKRFPQVVYDSSYFIYLAHYVFFLSFIDEAFFSIFGTSNFSLSLHYLFCPLLKAVILTLVYLIYRRLKVFFFPSDDFRLKKGVF